MDRLRLQTVSFTRSMFQHAPTVAAFFTLCCLLASCTAPQETRPEATSASTAASADPLPSWSHGAARKAIVDFMERTTRHGGPDFVPAAERIAVFDIDGTLWAEQHQVIGRRPTIAFGNSDGDFEMLEWTTSARGPRLGVIVHHTDDEREWAYDRDSHIGQLVRGLDEGPRRGWVIVDMKSDWKVIYPMPH
jgi:hypothetical protein